MSIGKNSLKRVQSAAAEKESAHAPFIVSEAPDMEGSTVLPEKKPVKKAAPKKSASPKKSTAKAKAKKASIATVSYPIGAEMPIYLL